MCKIYCGEDLMADGRKYESAEKLNSTLTWIVDILNEKNIDNWFVSYGTLLGLIREDSCIDGDDDVDICISKEHWDDVYDVLKKKNLIIPMSAYVQDNFFCTVRTSKLCQVDFYFCDVTEDGDFIDTWEKVKWSMCYNVEGSIPTKTFQGREVRVPENAIQKLEGRYGSTWRQRIKRGTPAGDGYRDRKSI